MHANADSKVCKQYIKFVSSRSNTHLVCIGLQIWKFPPQAHKVNLQQNLTNYLLLNMVFSSLF